MSVREVTDRFVGLRVQRKLATEAKPRIKNFSYRIPVRRAGVTAWRDATDEEKSKLLAQAHALDAEWSALQADKAARQTKEFNPVSARTNTGITGIRYGWGPDSQGYLVEAFWINVTVRRKTHAGFVRLTIHDWKAAWSIAVEKLAQFKNLDTNMVLSLQRALPKAKILREKPPSPAARARSRAESLARRLNKKEAN